MKKIYILLLLSLLAASCATHEKPEALKIPHPGIYFRHNDMKKIAKGIYVSERNKDIVVYSDAITSFELLTPGFKNPPELAGRNYNEEETRVRMRLELLHSGTMELSFYAPHYRFYIPKKIKQVFIERRKNKIHALYVPGLGGLGTLEMGSDGKWSTIYELKKKNAISEKVFGKAVIKLGMTKDEVLKQIDLSRSQYKPLASEKSSECYIAPPNAETTKINIWILNCPSRNSKYLGSGSGIVMRLIFKRDKLKTIEILPWMGG